MDITGLVVIGLGLIALWKQKTPYGDTMLWKDSNSYIISNKGDYINEN